MLDFIIFSLYRKKTGSIYAGSKDMIQHVDSLAKPETFG
jgi:hypothetical protein